MLDVLGMHTTAKLVYREMLAHRQDGVADLMRRLELTEEAVRTALDTLSELALVIHSPEDPQSFHVVDPHLAAEILLARQRAELAAQQQRAQEVQAAAVQLKSEFAQEGVADEVHRLKGADSVRDYLAAMCDEVQDELLTFAPGGYQSAQVATTRRRPSGARGADAYRVSGQHPQRSRHDRAHGLAGSTRRTSTYRPLVAEPHDHL